MAKKRESRKKKDDAFHVPLGAVLGGLMTLVIVFSLAVWLPTFILGNNSLADLNRDLTKEIGRHVGSRLSVAVTEQARSTEALSRSLMNPINDRGDSLLLPFNSTFEAHALAIQVITATHIGARSFLSSLAILDTASNMVVGSFSSKKGSDVANVTGTFSFESCDHTGNWSSTFSSPGNASLIIDRIGLPQTTRLNFELLQRNGIPAETGFGAGGSVWPGMTRSQLTFSTTVTLPGGHNNCRLFSTVSLSTFSSILRDLQIKAESEVSAFVVDVAVPDAPVVIADNLYTTELCSNQVVSDDCSDSACDDSRGLAPPALHHSSIDAYIIENFGSWGNSYLRDASFESGGKRQTILQITPVYLASLPSITETLNWRLVISAKDSNQDALAKDQIVLICILCACLVIQVLIMVAIIRLIRSPLGDLRNDINKASQMDMTQGDEEQLAADRIGGFQILAEHYNHVLSEEDDEDEITDNRRPDHQRTQKLSLFSEVAALQKGFNEMLTTIRSFSFYVPQDVVTRLIRKGELATLSMNYKFISLMFIDVESFTEMCEKIRERRLVKIMEIYFGICGEVIADSGGTVDKYIGDAVMAFWGAPTPVDSMNARASLAALMIQNQINDPATQEIMGDINFRTRIGIHGGRALCGNLGCRKRMNFTALGDSVNLAARLESLNKEYGTRIMISSQVARDVQNMCVVRQLGKVTVKGKSIATDVYELVGIHPKSRPLFSTVMEEDATDPQATARENANRSLSMGSSMQSGQPGRSNIRSALGSTARSVTDAGGDLESNVYSTGAGAADNNEALFSVSELLELCRRELEVDDTTLEFCQLYSGAVQQYLRGEFVGSLETFSRCKKHLEDDYSQDAMRRKAAMDSMVKEMENIMNSGFGGGMTTSHAITQERFSTRAGAAAASASHTLPNQRNVPGVVSEDGPSEQAAANVAMPMMA